MNEQTRWIIFIVLSMTILFYFQIEASKKEAERRKWLAQHAEVQEAPPTATPRIITAEGVEALEASLIAAAEGAVVVPEDDVEGWRGAERVTLNNGRVLVEVSAWGGRIENWETIDPFYATNYKHQIHVLGNAEALPEDFGDPMIMDYPGRRGIPRRPLELSLIINGRNQNRINSMLWTLERSDLPDGTQSVRMVSPEVEGLRVVKVFTLPPDSFRAEVSVRVENRSDSNMRFENNGMGLGLTAWGTGLGEWHRLGDYFDFSKVLYRNDRGGHEVAAEQLPFIEPIEGLKWAAVANRYLLAGVMVSEGTALSGIRASVPSDFRAQAHFPTPYILEAFGAPFTLRAGAFAEFDFTIFAAPQSPEILREIGGEHELNRALFHNSWNWFRALCLGMLWLLYFFHDWLGSWGWAIMGLTVLMKLITHPINHRALRINAQFQREMAIIKPQLDAIKEKYKDDYQAQMAAQQRIMREHKINMMAPLQGCIPTLLQIPIFFALYWILGRSVALRGEPFLWINDLSMNDALIQNVILGFDLNVLPFLMVITQIIAMRISTQSANLEPSQKMLFYFMPAMMLFFLYNMAAGLFVYWVAQNIWQIGHTMLTNKEMQHTVEVAKAQEVAQAAAAPPSGTSLRERRHKGKR